MSIDSCATTLRSMVAGQAGMLRWGPWPASRKHRYSFQLEHIHKEVAMATRASAILMSMVGCLSLSGLLFERSLDSLRGGDIWESCGKCDEKENYLYECWHWNLEPTGMSDCYDDICLESINYYASCQDDWEDPPPCEVDWAYVVEYRQQARAVPTPPNLSCNETIRYLPDVFPELIDTSCQEPGWGLVEAKCFLNECEGTDIELVYGDWYYPEYWEWAWVCVPPCEPYCE
jgi:hypothetical protein